MNAQDSRRALAPEFERLRQQYLESLPGRMAGLESAWETAQATGSGPEALAALHQQVHRLAGSAAMYGFAAIGQAARAVEARLGPPPGDGAAPRPADAEDISWLLAGLRAAVEAANGH